MKLMPNILNRRGFIARAAAFMAAPAAMATTLPVPASKQLHFKIFRNGTAIGEQFVSFAQTGSNLKVNTQADMVVRIAGIPIFHYHADVTEHWRAGEFYQLKSQVNHNGDHLMVSANPIAGGFAIESTKAGNYDYVGTQKMMPLTYWNKAMLQAMILNVETGHHYPAIVQSPGWNWLKTVEGGRILAQQFDITGELHFNIWYDQTGEWAGLAFNVDGHEMFQKYVA